MDHVPPNHAHGPAAAGTEPLSGGAADGEEAPISMVVVLLDSLNRHLIGAYGGTEFATPEIDALSAASIRFDNHVTGSLPCIPARHDLFTGALDFLWRPWGSIELWEEAFTRELASVGVVTKLVTDHPHLFELGGENYHTEFTAWEYLRGHESDPWRSAPDPSALGSPYLPEIRAADPPRPADLSRTWFRSEEDFPGPRTMAAAADWLRLEAPRDRPFLLVVDEFDPHEPFDVPEPWASRYGPPWSAPRIVWPPYARDVLAKGILDPTTAAHIRANYGAKLSMIDHWLGRILDTLAECGLERRVVVVLCTDHGLFLGEHDLFGKPPSPIYAPMRRIPLLVRWPGIPPRRCSALTTTVDLHATVCDFFGVRPAHRTHGVSLLPLLGEQKTVRPWALTGVWGRLVHVTDGHVVYGRAPKSGNFPLALWSNRWSTMPRRGHPLDRLPNPDARAELRFMPGSSVPVIRQPFTPGDMLPFHALDPGSERSVLFSVEDDPAETHDLAGTRREREAEELLVEALRAVEAPIEQFERLGLS